MSETFREGLESLCELGKIERCCIMCAEVVWWKCHRRLITDYLLLHGYDVYHILSLISVKKATCTPGAKKMQNDVITYPSDNKTLDFAVK